MIFKQIIFGLHLTLSWTFASPLKLGQQTSTRGGNGAQASSFNLPITFLFFKRDLVFLSISFIIFLLCHYPQNCFRSQIIVQNRFLFNSPTTIWGHIKARKFKSDVITKYYFWKKKPPKIQNNSNWDRGYRLKSFQSCFPFPFLFSFKN